MDFFGIMQLVGEKNVLIVSRLQKEILLKYAAKNKVFLSAKLMTYDEFFDDYFVESKEQILAYIYEIFGMEKIDFKYMNKIYELLFYSTDKMDGELFCLVNKVKVLLQINDLRIYQSREIFTDSECISELVGASLIDLSSDISKVDVVKFDNVIDEVNSAALEIVSLVNSGVSFNNIYVYSQYDKAMIRMIFYSYNIVIDESIVVNPLVESKYKKLLAEMLSCCDESELLSCINSYELLDYSSLSVVSKYLVVKASFDTKLGLIVEALRGISSNSVSFTNKVSLVSQVACFSSDDYVLVLGYNSHVLPQKGRDDYLFSEEIAQKFAFPHIMEINNKYKQLLLNLLSHQNSYISCQASFDLPDIVDVSCSVGKFEFGCKSMNFVKYAKLDQEYKKFNITSETHGKLKDHYDIVDYRRPKYLLSNRVVRNSDISATTIEYYYQCPFKFYVSKVLKIRPDSSNVKMIIGNLLHKGLEVAMSKGLSLALVALEEEYYKQNIVHESSVWLYYKRQVEKNLSDVVQELVVQQQQSNFEVSFVEESFDIQVSQEYNISLKGMIDKVISYDNYVAVIDYKSNVKKINLGLLDFGIGIQNFIYLFVLKHNFADKIVAGTYRQSIIRKIVRLSEEKRFDYYLEGYTRNDGFSINNLDTNVEDSFIKGLKTNKDGSLRKSNVLLPDDSLELLVDKVKGKIDFMVDKIVAGEFIATDKVMVENKKMQYISCGYCPYLDICQKTKEERIYLEVKDEMDR